MSAHIYWMSVVAALRAEPQCELRDGFLSDMERHEPVRNGDLDEMVCLNCSRWTGKVDVVVVAPCEWITEWGKRLEVPRDEE